MCYKDMDDKSNDIPYYIIMVNYLVNDYCNLLKV